VRGTIHGAQHCRLGTPLLYIPRIRLPGNVFRIRQAQECPIGAGRVNQPESGEKPQSRRKWPELFFDFDFFDGRARILFCIEFRAELIMVVVDLYRAVALAVARPPAGRTLAPVATKLCLFPPNKQMVLTNDALVH
jgi:hypothetical protein